MSAYAYRKPSRINSVSVFLALLVAAGIYAAWKFVPHYTTAWKVDRVLQDVSNRAGPLLHLTGAEQEALEGELTAQARSRIAELGIDDPELEVYFSPLIGTLRADYAVIVEHPFDKRTRVAFRRKVRVPGGGPD
jgi:hypothetical protein